MTPNGLGLDTANHSQGLDVIPAGTQVELVMKISAGNIGLEGLLQALVEGRRRGSRRRIHRQGRRITTGASSSPSMLLDGTTAGHAKAAEITRALLRAIFEAVNGIDPNDNSPATIARRANATLAGFNGATFLATLEVEHGGKRPDGTGNYRDKNMIGKVLRVGDQGYRKLEQPPPAPIERSAPPAQPQPPPPRAEWCARGRAGTAIAHPSWAQ